MLEVLLSLLPHCFLVYAVLCGLTGISLVPLCITIGLLTVMFAYKLPKSSKAASDSVFGAHDTEAIAHKGGALDAPENTLAAIRLASKNGATAVEFDLDYTQDGEAVVIHDDTVDRTTDGTGLVNQMSLKQIRALSASAKHPLGTAFPNEKVPTLEEVISLCLELGLKMYIDVKGNALLTAKRICDLYKRFPDLYKAAAVCSFYPQIVYMVKRTDHQIVTGLTHRRGILAREADGTLRNRPFWKMALLLVADVILEWAMYSWLWHFCGISTFLIWNKDASPNKIKDLQDHGLHVVVWTVNDLEEKKYLKNVVQVSYMTDTLKEHISKQ